MSSSSTSVGAVPTITDNQKAKSITAAVKAKRTREQGIRLVPLLGKSIRLAVLLLVIWLVGYLGLSLTWVLLGGLIYTCVWEYRRVLKDPATDMLSEDAERLLARVDELPQWVYFPDIERAEWLNKIILKMWPFIGVYVKNLLITTVAPIINDAMPSRLTPFVFDMVDLGTVPPRVGGVKVYTDNIQRNEVMMDIEVMFAGDAKLKVSLHGLRAGVKDITMTGVVRVILKPLVSKVPIIGGLSVYFLAQPNIDFELTDVANVLELPLLSMALRTIVNDQIANYLVLPHKIPIPLIDTLEEAIFMIPKGVIRVTLIEARSLEKTDMGFLGKKSSDPYCKIKAGRTSFQTKIVKSTISPVWNDLFQFVVTSENPVLEISVYDKDPNEDDFLGRVKIDLSSVAEAGSFNKWFTLEDVKKGEIHASLEWFNLSKDPASLEQVKSDGVTEEGTSTCILMVIVDSIKSLPLTLSSYRELRPCVHLQVGNSKQTTSVKENAINPKWEDEFTFMISDPDMQELSVEVLDAGNKGAKPLGDRKIPLQDLLSCSDMQISRPYGLRNSGPETSITLRLCLRVLTPASQGTEDEVDVLRSRPLSKETNNPADCIFTHSVSGEATDQPLSEPLVAQQQLPFESEQNNSFWSRSAGDSGSLLKQRRTVVASDSKYGSIQISLRYSLRCSQLVVVVHHCANLMPCDPDIRAVTYVQLLLLSDRSSFAKCKTHPSKDNSSPTFDETFFWPVARDVIGSLTLQVLVKNQVRLFSRGRPIKGMLRLDLAKFSDLACKPCTNWYDLGDPNAGGRDEN